jgi:hypothetical protein
MKCPTTVEHPDQPEDERTAIPDKSPVEEQHSITDAMRTKQQQWKQLIAIPPKEQRKRPMAADYFDQPEDGSTDTNSDEPLVKKQRIADESPQERLIVTLQKEHASAHEGESQAASLGKRPAPANDCNQEEERSTTTNSNESSTKKQRLASTRISEPVDINHIRRSTTDVYISA